jgi:hypothetical protein
VSSRKGLGRWVRLAIAARLAEGLGGGIVMTPDQPPELVFVPARPQVSGDARNVAYETRTLADGTVARPVYSTVTKLVAALGHYQPWMCLPLHTVRADMAKAGVHQIVVDAQVDTSAWRWREGGLRILADGLPQ